jgi:hypothetical protein
MSRTPNLKFSAIRKFQSTLRPDSGDYLQCLRYIVFNRVMLSKAIQLPLCEVETGVPSVRGYTQGAIAQVHLI